MASPVAAEEHSNTKSEEGTTAFHKKRSRRVSFAESTSIHIFDRYEEIETPSDRDAPSSPYEDLGFSDRDGEPMQLFGNEDEDMDDLGPRSPFFRLVRSPSSGGSTIGSATSNDEDNFFGPVSKKFIRQGFSDSAVSNEDHDHTMDSTAFSMNFRSIARSDSEADMNTSTGVQTPTSSAITSNTRSPMRLTLDKKPFCQPDVSNSKLSTGSHSNDMSLVGTYHDKYDYGKLSPAPDVLNDFHAVLSNSMLKSPLKSAKLSRKENVSDLTPSNGENQKHGGSVLSLQKSISKLGILEDFPFSPALNAKLQDSYSKSKSLNTYLNESETSGNLTNFVNDKEHEKVSIFTATVIPMGQNLADEFGKSSVNNKVLQNDHIDPNRDEPSAERKRKRKDMMTEKISRIKWSSSDSGVSRFFKETKLFSHSVHDMNLHAIDRLVDIVGQLQRSKTYELLSNEIQSQTTLDSGSKIHEKRKAEIKQLLCKTMYEKTKLQLLHAKKERLQKNRQSLVSGIQKSESLKLKYSPQNLLNAQVIHHQPFSDNTRGIQEQAVKDIDSKISNLVESFHVSCKMKEGPPAETIAFVKNHLMKKVQCQIIRKETQLWVVDDLKSSKDHHVLVLNYLDLMTQRFTVTGGVVTTISVSNILNETNIIKKFKDLDALTAFRFVFDGGLTEKNVGDANLAHETQITSSLLGNLVDVMEEIQAARFELKNLMYARFSISSDEDLHLELYFFDSISRKKATITLNISCLKRGIYPSEFSSSSSLSLEIAASIKDLRVGFLRILRVCRCISHVVSRSR